MVQRHDRDDVQRLAVEHRAADRRGGQLVSAFAIYDGIAGRAVAQVVARRADPVIAVIAAKVGICGGPLAIEGEVIPQAWRSCDA